jgi:hypothetical protein
MDAPSSLPECVRAGAGGATAMMAAIVPFFGFCAV